jgi:glycosyltransferase involved in cell wall biosynthesis
MEVLRVPIFPRGAGRSWELVLNYLSFVFFAVCLGLPRLRGRKFDACIAWCSSPITIAIPAIAYRFLSGTPVAIWVQDLWPETFTAITKSRSTVIRLMLSRLVGWIYRHVDQIWIQSLAYRHSVLAHGGSESQIRYVPNWAEDFYDCEGEAWKSATADILPPNALVFAGNMGRAQGLESVIDAVERVEKERKPDEPQANWVLVGEGVLLDWLKDEVRKRGLEARVTFLPRRPPADMPKLLKSASAVLVTLTGDGVFAQTIPSKVQSCLASGRPIVAAISGEAARVILESESGLVCRPDDPSTLAKIVKDFLRLPEEERARMGRNGHSYFRSNFKQSQIVARILDDLKEL